MTFQILITTTITKVVSNGIGTAASVAIDTNVISFDSEIKADEIHRKLSSCSMHSYGVVREVEKLY